MSAMTAMTGECVFKVQLVRDGAEVPKRASSNAAGYDLFACDETTMVHARSWACIGTGIAVSVPIGTYGRIAPRSGLSLRGTMVGAGVIDADYRGEIKVLLFNHSDESICIGRGDRIAQLLLEKIVTPVVELVTALDETERGGNGFGSTGV